MLKARTARSETGLRLFICSSSKWDFIPLGIIAVGVVFAALAFSVARDDAERLAVEQFYDAADTVGLTV